MPPATISPLPGISFDQPPVVAGVDDAAEVRARARVVAEEVVDRFLHAGQERFLDGLMDEDVIRRDARLPGVVKLAPDDAPGGHVEIGLLVDDARALAAELERDRRQVLGGGFHDDAPDGAVARVEDVIESLGQKLGRLRRRPPGRPGRTRGRHIRATARPVRRWSLGTSSLGLTIAQLPAAIAPTSGASTSWSG